VCTTISYLHYPQGHIKSPYAGTPPPYGQLKVYYAHILEISIIRDIDLELAIRGGPSMGEFCMALWVVKI